MKLSRIIILTGVALATACASVTPVNAPEPVIKPGKVPVPPTPPESVAVSQAPVAVRTGSWKFAYTPGTYEYAVTTDAIVAPVSDTTQKRQLPELNQTTTITLSATGDIQVVVPAPPTSSACDSAVILITVAKQITPRLPDHLAVGQRWRDSTTTSGCRGMIPATSQIISNYTVLGDTTFANAITVQIVRLDSLTAIGEGSEGQHRIHVTATGTGTTDLFVNTGTGALAGSSTNQSTLVSVTTSGRLTQFLQRVRELVVLKQP